MSNPLTGQSILSHPAKEQIDKMILGGTALTQVVEEIHRRYRSKGHKKIGYATMHGYKKNFLQMTKEMTKEARDTKGGALTTMTAAEALDRQKEQDALTADGPLNIEGTAKYIYNKILDRVAVMESQDAKHLNDKVIVDYLGQMRMLLVDFNNLVRAQEADGRGSSVTITIGQAEHYASILKSCIQDVLVELDPALVPVFLRKLEERVELVKTDTTNLENVFKNTVKKAEKKLNIEVDLSEI